MVGKETAGFSGRDWEGREQSEPGRGWMESGGGRGRDGGMDGRRQIEKTGGMATKDGCAEGGMEGKRADGGGMEGGMEGGM